MKRYRIILCLLLATSLAACTDGFERMNQNANALNNPDRKSVV